MTSQKALPQLTVADVFITDELDQRAPKKTDYLQEKLALQDVAARMADQPEEVLPRFVDLALEMTGGVSAGLSLYEESPPPGVFRWQYLRGRLAPFDGATTPRDFSPCGITLDRNAPVLAQHPERVYGWIADANIVVPEVLLVPLYLGGKVPLGTLWIVSDREGHFDSGHARALTELAAFVGIALRMVRSEHRLNQALEAQERAAEATLRNSEAQFRLLVQGVTDYSIYMLGLDGRVASWNAGAQRIKGYQPEEIIGQHFSRFYTEEDRQNGEPERALATAIREGRFEKEGLRVRKNGERFWANVIIDAIRGDDGEIIGFAKITRDITEQREARAALDRARETLFQSQKMEAVGQLTGGIAHDFNNLLTAVIGSLEIAERRVSDVSVKRLLSNAMRGAQRGAALTQRMLVFARRHELNSQPLEIPMLVRGMSEMLERSLGPSVLIETRFPLNLPWIKTDPNQLEMALLNLIVNARDAMPQGGPIIVAAFSEAVGEGQQLRPGSYVCLSVTDSGGGMDAATLAKATDPFFTTKEVGKGTGLGLPMVHGLAQESGGALVLKSRKGKGTTAELWFPVAEKSPVAATVNQVFATATKSRKLTILVVDDDPLVLTNMAAMLEDLGHTVHEASSALEALAILGRESAIELVLTDQAMPQMTGAELIGEINSRWPKLPAILATGFAELPSGIDPLQQITLAKPFLQDALEQAVNGALEDPKKRRVVRFR
ncbi:MAG TPA: PAS domain S-box protein, partial [Bradyrhizobium sp.]|jgi:PAS domain S-box-containing protein|nr:PAS domain S-box protein [Bradyrhizobium sp.]